MMPRVKRITPEDTALLRDISALEAVIFTDAWSEESILSAAENLRTRIYAALNEQDALMGYLIVTQVMDVADIDNIAVSPDFRRQGIASLLLDTALERMDADVFLEVRASNAPAIELYQKYGFAQIGIRKHYYEKPREDAILMKRERETAC